MGLAKKKESDDDLEFFDEEAKDLEKSLEQISSLLSQGEPMLAYNKIMEFKQEGASGYKIGRFEAQALVRMRMLEKAQTILLEMIRKYPRDVELLGILARTYKELYQECNDLDLAKKYFDKAHKYYELAYKLEHRIWTGINYASLLLVSGKNEQAIKIAEDVIRHCSGEDFWTFATMGEAYLIKREIDKAVECYTRAIDVGSNAYGDLCSTWSNAKLVLQELDLDHDEWARVYKCFPIPKIVLFKGHMMDDSDAEFERFPARLEQQVRDKLSEILEKLGTIEVYASAANGSDIIFLEEVSRLGHDYHIVLPFDKELFIETSVRSDSDDNWESRFEFLIDNAKSVTIASNRRAKPDDTYYEFANKVMNGLARLRAKQLQTDIYPVAVWDPYSDSKVGITTALLQEWQDRYSNFECVELTQFDRKVRPKGKPFSISSRERRYTVKAILFADTVGYSKLGEEEYPFFEEKFWSIAGQIADQGNYDIDLRNTWGDAIFMVFPDVAQAGHFALELAEKVTETDWELLGFSTQLNLRIALHCGPVFKAMSSITGNATYVGHAVCKAARLEPVTPPGNVFVSLEFAAITQELEESEFDCEYTGEIVLPKGYGVFAAYLLQRSRGAFVA